MKYPLLSVVALLIAGTILGQVAELPVVPLFAAGFCGCILCLWSPRSSHWALPLLVTISGTLNMTLHQQIISPHDLRTILGPTDQLATIRGRVLSVTQRPTSNEPVDAAPRFAVELESQQVKTQDETWRSAHGTILATLKFPGAERLASGQVIELFGVIGRPSTAPVPGMFDYRRYLARRGIYFMLRAEVPSDLLIVDAGRSDLTTRFRRWATATLLGDFHQGDDAMELLRAMCLGWRTALTDEVREPFMKSGTMHLFAISGLHVALIAGVLTSLLRFCRLEPFWCGFIILPTLWFYTGATGWQASAIRSTIMASVILLGWSLRRPTELLNTLCMAATIVLLWDPGQLFQAGFQLSFAVVGVIALVLPRVAQWPPRGWFADPFLPDRLRSRANRSVEACLRYVISALAVSGAAWLGSLPLIMYYFHLITPLSMLANIVVVQMGGGAIASALGCLLTAPLVPGLADLFRHSMWFLMNAMADTSQWFASLPAAWAYTRTPPGYVIISYYAAVATALFPGQTHSNRARRYAAVLFGAITLIGAIHGLQRPSSLTLIPLDGGLSVFVENVNHQDWLIDCGDAAAYRYRTREFLKTRGVNRIDSFVATHGDARHIGGARDLIDEFRPREILLNPLKQRSSAYRRLRAEYPDENPNIRSVGNGDRIGPWRVLHPGLEDGYRTADDGTLVMLLEHGKSKVLLCGDLGPDGRRHFSERHPDLKVDVLVISPGVSPVHPSWLEQFNPGDVIIADSTFPANERTPNDHRVQLRERLPHVRFMSEEGAIRLPLE